MAIHDGHRERLKHRFLKEGLDHFTDVQVLELLLFYCIPRRDTNVLAHRLLERFGSLSRVLEAKPEKLMSVEGVGENTALFLSLISAAERFAYVDQQKNRRQFMTIEECGEYLLPFFKNRGEEMVYLLCLDAKCQLLSCQLVGEGSVNSANVPVRRIVERALASNASTVVLAHNHPSGLALPSHEDVLTTKHLAAALDAVDITLSDHLVVAEGEFVSLAQSGYYRPGECR